MANTESAKKSIRRTRSRTVINTARRSRVRSFIRKVEEAVTRGDYGEASVALRSAEPEIMRAARRGILHGNTASRKVSRLSARIRKMKAASS